jgi:L-ascorbate metabolism protein UlaG (beta-lactamase superfamily)
MVALPEGYSSRFLVRAVATAAGSPRIRYLANEGVLLEGAGGRVFIDAFFGDGLPDYPVVPAALRDSLERGLGGFAGPAAVLTTHAHRDHFDPTALARYLSSNAEAIAVGPGETKARLDSVPGTPRERTRAVGPTPASPAEVDLGWVRLRALAIPHGHTYRPVQHVAWLITLDGTTVLHLGDTNSDPSTWRAAGLPADGVDVALVPFWYALDEKKLEAVLATTRAHRVVLVHLALDPAGTGYPEDRGGWEAFARDLRKRFPAVELATRPGDELAGRASL